ncbi:hypothetical protein LSH36_9g02035 [Paralvinella palmiformis]|uniref:Uncharacterized protein n=1 Tax=Paralvinella palmiformis TaxID=53620 RepID=A0AAD9KE51_9ANNE|nr:hypothetical protein LSH36_9g02035 [Paralvinella palmiformis]
MERSLLIINHDDVIFEVRMITRCVNHYPDDISVNHYPDDIRKNKVAPEFSEDITDRRESIVLRKASSTFVKAKKNFSIMATANATNFIPSFQELPVPEEPNRLDLDSDSDDEESHA